MALRKLSSILSPIGLALALLALPEAVASEAQSDLRAEGDTWRVFTSAEGRFRVELPEKPRLERSERSSVLGLVREMRYILRFGELRLAVQTHDIPRVAARIVPERIILDRTRAGILEDMQAEPVAGGEATLQGRAARDFTYRVPAAPPLLERAVVVLVGNRLYLVTATAPESRGLDSDVARFFASFRYWEAGQPPPQATLGSEPGGPEGGS